MLRQWSTRISPLLFGMLVVRIKSDLCGDTTSQTHRLIFHTFETTSPCYKAEINNNNNNNNIIYIALYTKVLKHFTME